MVMPVVRIRIVGVGMCQSLVVVSLRMGADYRF